MANAPSSKYNKANELFNAGDILRAIEKYHAAGDYEDAAERLTECYSLLGDRIAAGAGHIVGLKSDGTVVSVVSFDDPFGEGNVGAWRDIVAVSANDLHTVGLRSDGTVVATGDNFEGECNVSGWNDIVAVSANENTTVGLRWDGTVVATGYNEDGQCDVSGWNDIVAVSAGVSQTVGLRPDGTVVAAGDNEYGQCNVGDWKDIVAVAAGGLPHRRLESGRYSRRDGICRIRSMQCRRLVGYRCGRGDRNIYRRLESGRLCYNHNQSG